MKNYKKTSWREAVRLNNRAIKLLFKEYPQFVLSRFFSIAVKSLSPYVGIYISALLINELTGAKNPEKIRLYVFAALFSAAARAHRSAKRYFAALCRAADYTVRRVRCSEPDSGLYSGACNSSTPSACRNSGTYRPDSAPAATDNLSARSC